MQEQNVKKETATTKEKKPIYKKWWFWVIIGVVLIAIAGGTSGTDDEELNGDNPNNNITENDKWYKSGTYKVGEDIEPGEYLVVSSGYLCYFEVNKDSSGTFDSIVSNENVSNRSYITLYEGQYFKLRDGKFIEASKAPAYNATDGVYTDGMYKVGKDIEAGEYKVEANDSYCYIEVDKDSRHIFDSIVSNDNLALGETTYITIKTGQYIIITGGKMYK